MARYLYAGTPGDYLTRGGRPVAGETVIVSTAGTDASITSDITAGTVGTVAAGVITADAQGQFSFRGPDGYTGDLYVRAQDGGPWLRATGPANDALPAQYARRGAVDVRLHGAVLDGVTDDTAAWSAALSAASTGEKVVTAPPGTSLVGEISVPAGVTVRGAGIGRTTLKLKNATNTPSVRLLAGSVLEDVTIDGNKANQTSSGGVNASAADAKVRRVRVENSKNYGIYGTSCSRFRVADCEVVDSDNIGIFVQATTAAIDDVRVEGCHVDRSALGTGIVEGGIKVRGDATYAVRRSKVNGNTVLMPTSPTAAAAICVEASTNCPSTSVEGNHTSGGSMGISVAGTCHRSRVIGNDVAGPSLYGIEVVTANGVKVIGNDIDGAGLATRGVAQSGTMDRIVIAANNIEGATTYGIYTTSCARPVIVGNEIHHSTNLSAAIYLTLATYATVTGNTTDGGGTGNGALAFEGGNCQFAISGNTFQGFDVYGVRLYATSAATVFQGTITGNTIIPTAGNAYDEILSDGATVGEIFRLGNRGLDNTVPRAFRHTGTTLGFYGAAAVAQPAANPDTTGATLTALETEVNELKALLRSVGLMAP